MDNKCCVGSTSIKNTAGKHLMEKARGENKLKCCSKLKYDSICKDCHEQGTNETTNDLILKSNHSSLSFKPSFRSLSSISTYLSFNQNAASNKLSSPHSNNHNNGVKTQPNNGKQQIQTSKSFTNHFGEPQAAQIRAPSRNTNSTCQSPPCCAHSSTCSTPNAIDKHSVTEKSRGMKLSDKRSKYSMIKRPTFRILRDVKNSVAQRWRQVREDSRFERLENDDPNCLTPDVKLYSPFNVSYAESPNNGKSCINKAADLSFNQFQTFDSDVDDNEDHDESSTITRKKNYKLHQRRLVFDSPSGKLQQSVNEIEQLQRDLMQINEKICARNSVGS